MTVLAHLRRRDPGLSALRRAGRVGIQAPLLLALGLEVMGAPNLGLFAAIASVAMLVFVDFQGRMRDRLAAQACLIAVEMVLIAVGTLASQSAWIAAASTFVVAFGVLFAGIVSSVIASASTSLLLSYILSACVPGTVGALPDRLGGWALAGAASMVSISLLWPSPTREPTRTATARACALLARRLRSEVSCARGGFSEERRRARDAVTEEATAAVSQLRTSFYGTPYRPTGLDTATRTLVRLVDQVIWLQEILSTSAPGEAPGPADATVSEVKLAAADLLERVGALLEAGTGAPDAAAAELRRLAQARSAMEQAVTTALPAPRATGPEGDGRVAVTGFVSSLEPSFRAQEMALAVTAIAMNTRLTLAARERTWWERVLGRRPEGVGSALESVQERAGAHVERHSVWLHNSLRGAVALALSVLVAEVSGLQHSFWVVFGTIAVLRSSSFLIGQSALRAVLGTAEGMIVGSGLIFLLGGNTTVFWILLPLALVFTGSAPSAISFAAGQAGFTATLLIMFTIIEPAGWTVGLVRVEDVAIGCAVTVLVGAVFWPRGAATALGQSLAEAFEASARYLRSAVDYGVTRCDVLVAAAPSPQDERRAAAAAARRLDDAFRGFLTERGTKHLPLADVTVLLTAVAVLRLTADAILELWTCEPASEGDRTAARAELTRTGESLVGWYERTARALSGDGLPPSPLEHDTDADDRLVEAVRRDLVGADGQGSGTAIRMIWTADHLDAAHRLQSVIAGPATHAATLQSRYNERSTGLLRHVRRPDAGRV